MNRSSFLIGIEDQPCSDLLDIEKTIPPLFSGFQWPVRRVLPMHAGGR